MSESLCVSARDGLNAKNQRDTEWKGGKKKKIKGKSDVSVITSVSYTHTRQPGKKKR